MTLQELLEIKSILTNYLNSESCADVMADEEVKAALEVIEREIKLKTEVIGRQLVTQEFGTWLNS